MTYSDLIKHAIRHDAQAAYLRARDAGDKYGAENIAYHCTQRNWACDHLRDMGFDLPAPVHGEPEVLTQALAELAERVMGGSGMSDAPERIFATAYYSQNRSEHVQAWSEHGFEGKQHVEYTRTDAIPNAAYVAGLEAAASHLLLNYLQDEHDEPDLCVDCAHWSAIHDLHNALASRPASPDVLVVGGYRGTTEQLCNALDEMIAREKRQMQASILQAARAIIGGQP